MQFSASAVLVRAEYDELASGGTDQENCPTDLPPRPAGVWLS
ncbi:Unknown protein sequence [Pseudomonas syringae pv. maculicola]|nr:Unknown protein sequence [Pseudomonas syringae pv. maculicola]